MMCLTCLEKYMALVLIACGENVTSNTQAYRASDIGYPGVISRGDVGLPRHRAEPSHREVSYVY